MKNNDSRQTEIFLNKETGELIIGSHDPGKEDGYAESLIDFVDQALYPLAGLCEILNQLSDEGEVPGLCSVIESLMHNTRSNIYVLTDFLERNLGKISVKAKRGKFVYTGGPADIPQAVVFKPAGHLLEYFELNKGEVKKLRAVSGAKG